MSGRGKRAEAHADERWLLTYADMITLLMALFMVLFSIAVVNKGKFDELAKSLRESFSGPLGAGGNSILNVGTPKPAETARSEVDATPSQIKQAEAAKRQARTNSDIKVLAKANALAAAQDRTLLAAKNTIDQRVVELHLEDKVKTEINSKGLVIRLITDKVLFDLGSSDVRPGAVPLISAVARAVNRIGSNPIRISGHTDAIPFPGNTFGNQRLSSLRAEAVLEVMAGHGFSLTRHADTASQGFADRDPLTPNDPATGAGPRNRRVEILVQRLNFEKEAVQKVRGALGADPAAIGAVAPIVAPGAPKIGP